MCVCVCVCVYSYTYTHMCVRLCVGACECVRVRVSVYEYVCFVWLLQAARDLRSQMEDLNEDTERRLAEFQKKLDQIQAEGATPASSRQYPSAQLKDARLGDRHDQRREAKQAFLKKKGERLHVLMLTTFQIAAALVIVLLLLMLMLFL
jgi:hypothetical protein